MMFRIGTWLTTLLVWFPLVILTACRNAQPKDDQASSANSVKSDDQLQATYEMLAENLLACAEADPWLENKTEFASVIRFSATEAERLHLADQAEVRSRLEAARNIILAHEYLCTRVDSLLTLPTLEDCKQYYDTHHQEFSSPEILRGRQILTEVTRNANPEQVRQAEAKIERLHAQLQAGEDFSLLARNFSDGPEAMNGGELGPISRGMFAKSFEAIIFQLDKGSISQPFRTEYGFHIVQVLDRDAPALAPFEQVEAQIRSLLLAQRRLEIRKQILASVRNAKID